CGYGRRGEAPDEYVNMGACAVTPTGDNVVIVDSYAQRMLFYDLRSGEFKQRVEFPVGTLDMVQQCVFLSDSVALLARYVYNNKNAVYAVANIADKTVEDFDSVGLRTENVAMPTGGHTIAEYQGKAVYVKPFEPAIYQYPDTKWLYIEQDKKIYNEQELAEISDFSMMSYLNAMNEGYCPGYTSVYVLKDWILLGFLDSEFSLIEKSGWKMTTYEYVKDNMAHHKNVGSFVGAIPERNTLFGADNGPMSESDQIYIYKLPSR
ncbi:MAG: 6-bladed beta-propeller, partial [Muribaculaceae bacterium]|nr:6-bladed beta-propeller [Muribaculaceae bacterium]